MKILIIGGHLTPALSVIEMLPKDAEILYVGRKHSMEGDRAVSLEYETVQKLGLPFVELKTGRLQRSLTRHSLVSLTKIPFGFVKAASILHKFKPEVILGFGGYLSFPVVFAASFLNIPVVIHEQTLGAGTANKLCAKYADKICISFDSSSRHFPKGKTILTGNPIREEILHPSKKFEIAGTEPVIYITGGSQGSHFINLMVEKNLPKLLDKYRVVHQTGGSEEFHDFEKLSILKEGLNNAKRDQYTLSKYFSPEQIGSILKSSDLTVSRAGINTVSELIVLKKPGLLIPLPVSSANEQYENAEFLKRLGLGEMEEQKDLTPEIFLSRVSDMMENIAKYKLNDRKSHFPKNSAQKIIDEVYATAKNSN